MERMVALTGRASLTPAASQDNQQPVLAAKTPATGEKFSAGKGAAERARDSPAGLPPQHPAMPLHTEGGAERASSAPSSADARAALPVSGTSSAAASKSAPAVRSSAASSLVPPEAAGGSVTAKDIAEKGVHAGETSVPHPTAASEGSSEADQLDFALKLSLNDAEEGSAAAPLVSTAVRSPGISMQSHAAGPSSAKNLPEVSESHTESPAAAHAALTAGTPDSSLSQPAEGSRPAEEPDHDFVVVEPEEAPGAGFEQVDMPKMGNASAGGPQELSNASVSAIAGQPQQATAPSKVMAEGPTADTTQHGPASPCNPPEISTKAAPAAVSVQAAGVAAEQPTGAAAEQVSATTDATCAESSPQPTPAALDERAIALLAALPKPGPAEGGSTVPSEPKTAGLPQQHTERDGAERAASGSDQKASAGAEGQGPGRLGMAAAPSHQIARAGSTKEAYLIQLFLDKASSQLTEHGLVSLHQVCSPHCLSSGPSF